jgi:thiamine-monophosphate kinase
MRLSELGEDRFLEKLREKIQEPGSRVELGIGDDAACLSLEPGEKALLSSDVLLEGIHFTRATLPPSFLGRKAVAVNVSDIAAMGGRPVALTVSLSVPADIGVEELFEFFDGVLGRCRELDVELVGGNLARSPGPIVVDVSILGETVGGKVLKRSGARPGESVFISGKLGASSQGLNLLKEGMALSAAGALLVPAKLRDGPFPLAESCIRAHMDPEPRVELGRFLGNEGAASACIDVSDGLGRDLSRLCRESRVGARIEETALPIDPGVLAWESLMRRPPLERALAGGEEYELLFTSSQDQAIAEWTDDRSLPVTRIGVITEAEQGIILNLRDGTEREIHPGGGWDHFLSHKT